MCEKYYKLITVQDNIANCVGWVPRLTLLNLRTNWTYKCALGMEWNSFVCRGLTVTKLCPWICTGQGKRGAVKTKVAGLWRMFKVEAEQE